MKDTNEPILEPWPDPMVDAPAQPTPAGALRGAGAQVLSISSFRAAPAGTPRDVIAQAVAYLAIARDMLMLGNWVRRTSADAAGEGGFPVHPMDPKAEAWTMSGALYRAHRGPATYMTPAKDAAWRALSLSVRARHNGASVAYFNDFVARSHNDCVAEFNAAIDLLAERT